MQTEGRSAVQTEGRSAVHRGAFSRAQRGVQPCTEGRSAVHFSYERLADRPRPRPKGRGGSDGEPVAGSDGSRLPMKELQNNARWQVGGRHLPAGDGPLRPRSGGGQNHGLLGDGELAVQLGGAGRTSATAK